VVHAGDWVGIDVVDTLESFELIGVCGNMDDHLVKERLPVKRSFKVGGFRFGLLHGWGGHGESLQDRAMAAFTDVDAVIFGHSHRPCVTWRQGVLLFNPGSFGRNRGGGGGTMGWLEVGKSIEARIVPV